MQTVGVGFPAGHRDDVATVDEHAAAVGRLEAGDQLQQRCLARAARAVERDELAARDRHRHPVDRVDGLPTPHPVVLDEIA